MPVSTVFTRAPWAVAAATLAGGVAMLLYPGGTPRDPSTPGYTLTRNFLSDLGMTVAYDGQPNRIGSALFIASIGLLVVGIGGALVGFVRLYATAPRARAFALLAGALGLLDCVAFIGVALAPENSALPLHNAFTLAAFRILPVVALLLTLAAYATPGMAHGVVSWWAALTGVLAAYVVVLQGGPWTATMSGFVAQVIAQKAVAIIIMLVVLRQCTVAIPITDQSQRDPQPAFPT